MGKMICAVLLGLCLHAPHAGAQVLWEGASYGMSPAQVQQRFPRAQMPEVPDKLAGGEVEGLRLADMRMAGHAFTASFFFGHDGLMQVMLGLDGMPAQADGMRAFEAVAGELGAAHGKPHSSEWTHAPFQRRTAQWMVDGATVKVFYMDVGTASIVNVIHQARAPDAPPGPRLRTPTGSGRTGEAGRRGE